MRRVPLLLALAILAAGCGGGGSSGAANRLSHTDLVSQANTVCAKYDGKLNALAAPHDVKGIAAYARRAAALASAELDALERLNPPTADEERYGQMIAVGRREVKLVGTQMRAAAANGDAKTVRDVANQVQGLDKQVDRIAARLGLSRCARPAPTG